MTNSRLAGLATLFLLTSLAAVPAFSQTKTAPTAKPPAADDAKKSAFLDMAEADRKAVQDALGWLGFYNGVVDGAYGKRTLEAITAYQASVKAPTDGIVSIKQLADLKAAMDKSRAAVGFKPIDDAATGIRVGAPVKLLDKRTNGAAQTRFSNRDGSITLELIALAPGAAKLEDVYKRQIEDGPDRKVTYKTLKAETFFVVAGEAAARKFFMRYGQAPAGAPETGALRGFVFSYPTAGAKSIDPIALAIANSFDPFPPGAKPTSGAPLEIAKPADGGLAAPSKPSGPLLTATALVIAQGQAITALREADCKDPTVDGKPVKIGRDESPGGLVLISGDFSRAAALSAGLANGDLVALGLSPGAAQGKNILEAINATSAPLADGNIAVVAGLSASARGAPIFDRRGGLVAIVAPFNNPPKRRGTVILAEPHTAIGGAALQGFAHLAAASPGGEALSAPEIARRMRAAVVGVYCGP